MDLVQGRIRNSAKHLNAEFFSEITKSFQPLTNFAKTLILDVWKGSQYAYFRCRKLFPKRFYPMNWACFGNVFLFEKITLKITLTFFFLS